MLHRLSKIHCVAIYCSIAIYCSELYFISATHSGASFTELYIQGQRNTCLVMIRQTQVKRPKWFVQSVVRRMNRQDSAEGDVVKREEEVARAFGFNLYQPAEYLGTHLLALKHSFIFVFVIYTE